MTTVRRGRVLGELDANQLPARDLGTKFAHHPLAILNKEIKPIEPAIPPPLPLEPAAPLSSSTPPAPPEPPPGWQCASPPAEDTGKTAQKELTTAPVEPALPPPSLPTPPVVEPCPPPEPPPGWLSRLEDLPWSEGWSDEESSDEDDGEEGFSGSSSDDESPSSVSEADRFEQQLREAVGGMSQGMSQQSLFSAADAAARARQLQMELEDEEELERDLEETRLRHDEGLRTSWESSCNSSPCSSRSCTPHSTPHGTPHASPSAKPLAEGMRVGRRRFRSASPGMRSVSPSSGPPSAPMRVTTSPTLVASRRWAQSASRPAANAGTMKRGRRRTKSTPPELPIRSKRKTPPRTVVAMLDPCKSLRLQTGFVVGAMLSAMLLVLMFPRGLHGATNG